MHRRLTIILVLLSSLVCILSVQAAPVTEIGKKERCPVCGMFVHKYPTWLAQVQMENGSTFFFDGVKDMLAFYFEPEKYGGEGKVNRIYVTEYYSQKWIDGTEALYVIGSEVLGPMGHEFIPLETQTAAEVFLEDHKGKMIKRFSEITLDQVNALRSGMLKMK